MGVGSVGDGVNSYDVATDSGDSESEEVMDESGACVGDDDGGMGASVVDWSGDSCAGAVDADDDGSEVYAACAVSVAGVSAVSSGAMSVAKAW